MTESTKKDLTGGQSSEVENQAFSKNTLTTVYTAPAVDVTAGTIEVPDRDKLIEAAKQYAAQAQSIVVTEDTEKEANATATDLNNLIRELDAKRKEIKKEYLGPLDSFEDFIKEVQKPFQESRQSIIEKTKVFKTQREEDRHIMVDALIATAAAAYDLEPSDISIDQRWYNATYEGGELKRGRDIRQAAKDAVQGKKFRLEKIKLVHQHAEELHMEASGWIKSLEAVDYDADKIISQMDEAQQRIAHERLAASVDEDTGEIVNTTVTLRITGPLATIDQLKAMLDRRADTSYEEV